MMWRCRFRARQRLSQRRQFGAGTGVPVAQRPVPRNADQLHPHRAGLRDQPAPAIGQHVQRRGRRQVLPRRGKPAADGHQQRPAMFAAAPAASVDQVRGAMAAASPGRDPETGRPRANRADGDVAHHLDAGVLRRCAQVARPAATGPRAIRCPSRRGRRPRNHRAARDRAAIRARRRAIPRPAVRACAARCPRSRRTTGPPAAARAGAPAPAGAPARCPPGRRRR